MKHVLATAGKYRGSSASEWRAAAATFRLPYLDWAADYVKEGGLPAFLDEPELAVVTPQGRRIIPNPFLAGTFQISE